MQLLGLVMLACSVVHVAAQSCASGTSAVGDHRLR